MIIYVAFWTRWAVCCGLTPQRRYFVSATLKRINYWFHNATRNATRNSSETANLKHVNSDNHSISATFPLCFQHPHSKGINNNPLHSFDLLMDPLILFQRVCFPWLFCINYWFHNATRNATMNSSDSAANMCFAWSAKQRNVHSILCESFHFYSDFFKVRNVVCLSHC